LALTSLTTNSRRLTSAINFVNSVDSSYYYMFGGSAQPFPNGNVPQDYDNPQTQYFNAYNNMLFGKYINTNDVSLLVANYPWTSGTVYSQYDDADPNLSAEDFFAYVQDGDTYYVFKCLYNNNGAPSTSAPNFADTSASDTYYQTADGYQWKYMFQFTQAQYNQFATAQYIPIVVDANVTGNAVPGAVDVILVEFGGAGYNNYYSNSFNYNSVVNSTPPLAQIGNDASKTPGLYEGCYLYITGGTGKGQYKQIVSHISNSTGIYVTLESPFNIVPDNTSTYDISPSVVILNAGDNTPNTAARALINANTGNSVMQIEILNRGSGVLYANAYVYASPFVGVSNDAVIRVIAGPRGGHGANVAEELYCSSVGISVTFANTESNTIPAFNDYQTVGLIHNPLFSNVFITVANQTGTFVLGETVNQYTLNSSASGVITNIEPTSIQLSNVSGFFAVSPNSSVGVLTGQTSGATALANNFQISGVQKGFETFAQYYRYEGSSVNGMQFANNETIFQSNVAVSNAVFYGNDAAFATVYVTNKYGPIYSSNTIQGSQSGAVFNINTVIQPDLVPESGDVLYLENFTSVSRANTQSEMIQLVMQY
jgi:hypothetical protein